MYKAFLIKYGEIGIKGKNRYLFEYALMDQIKFSLRKVDGQFEVTKEQGRVYVEALTEYDYDEVIKALSRVFALWPYVRLFCVTTTNGVIYAR